jgi:tetratricopeptide (TPR) repeat protein
LSRSIEQVKSYKPASVSVEIVDSDERLNIQLGEEDGKAAESSLYRELAYFLEIGGQHSAARDAWERSLTAIDRSNVDAKTNAKLKGLVWADLAQLCFESGKNSEAVDAIQKQIQYIRQSGVASNILAAALHNLGLAQLRLDNLWEARQSFEQALSASKKTSLQAAEDTIEIAHTWRLEGNLDRAISYYQAAADVAETLGEKGSYLRAVALGYLALGELEQGNLNSAYDNAEKARSLFSLQGASHDVEMADQLLQEIQRAREASH